MFSSLSASEAEADAAYVASQIGVEVEDTVAGQAGIYTLVRPLGGGATGTVYSAKSMDDATAADVAIKFYTGENGEEDRDRELELLGKLSGLCNLVACVVDQGETNMFDDSHPFIVIELVADACTVGDLVKYTSKLPQGTVDAPKYTDIERIMRGVMRQVAVGVEQMHKQGIAHNDLHAGNVLVTNFRSLTLDEWREAFPGANFDDGRVDVLTYLTWRVQSVRKQTRGVTKLRDQLSVAKKSLIRNPGNQIVQQEVESLTEALEELESRVTAVMAEETERLTDWVERNLDFQVRIIDFDKAVEISDEKVFPSGSEDPQSARKGMTDPEAPRTDVWQIGQLALWLIKGKRLLYLRLDTGIFDNYEITPEGEDVRIGRASLQLNIIRNTARFAYPQSLGTLGQYWTGRAEIPYPFEDIADAMQNEADKRLTMEEMVAFIG